MAPSVAIPQRNYLGTVATAPGPSGPQMLTRFAAIRRNPLEYLTQVWTEYGDVVQFPIPRPPCYMVNDPVAVRRVLVSNARNYGKATIQYRSLSLVTGQGLLTADTPQWRTQRPMVQPAFHRPTLNSVAAASVARTEQLADSWACAGVGASIDVDKSMMKLALEILGSALFGSDMSEGAGEVTAATVDALSVVVTRSRPSVRFPSWVPTPNNRKLAASVARLDRAVAELLAGRGAAGAHPTQSDGRRQGAAEGSEAAVGGPSAAAMPVSVPAANAGVTETGPDMVAMLTNVVDAAGAGMSRTQIRDQLVTFIVAGHETVASSLTWAIALLAGHPEVQARLVAEVDAVLGDRMPEYADLTALPYTRAVVDEALRLYPPGWLITRNALESDQLGGFEIPAGALVIISPWLLHRHPLRWDRPEVFDPERFRTGQIDRESFIPFGAGPRQCIGKDFAYVEMILVLATLARRIALGYPGARGMPDFDPSVMLRPKGGLELTVKEVRR